MFKFGFGDTIYVKMMRDKFRIKNIDRGEESEVNAIDTFSHPRSIIGDFAIAEKTLHEGLSKVLGSFLLRRPIAMVIHPIEVIEGGLTQVEDRALRELAAGANSRKIVVWQGEELNDNQVRELIAQC